MLLFWVSTRVHGCARDSFTTLYSLHACVHMSHVIHTHIHATYTHTHTHTHTHTIRSAHGCRIRGGAGISSLSKTAHHECGRLFAYRIVEHPGIGPAALDEGLEVDSTRGLAVDRSGCLPAHHASDGLLLRRRVQGRLGAEGARPGHGQVEEKRKGGGERESLG